MLKVGDRVYIIGRSSRHHIPINDGVEHEITNVEREYSPQRYWVDSNFNCYLFEVDIKLIPKTIEHMKKELIDATSKAAAAMNYQHNVESQLRWMEENGITEFDEQAFKVYRVVDLFEQANLSKQDKIRMLSKVLSNEPVETVKESPENL